MTVAAMIPRAGRRIGAAASIVSAANILVFAIVGLGFAAINTPHQIWRVPAGYFIMFGAVMVAVVLVSWPQGNRSVPAMLQRAPGFSLSSRNLTSFGLFAAIWVYSVVRMYDPITTVFGPYAVAAWICLLAGGLAYVRAQFDPPVVTLLTPLLTRVPDPSRVARVLSAISAVAFAAMLLFCIAIIPLQQLVYLAAHGGELPPGHGGAEALWHDHLPWHIPAAAFWLQPVVLAAVFLASFRPKNRWIPTAAFAGIRAVTPLRLSLLAVVSIFVQLPVLLYVQPLDGATLQYYGGAIILFLVFAAGVVASFFIGDSAPTKRGKRPRGAAPLVDVGKLPQLDTRPVAGWAKLPYTFPTDGFSNATAWAAGTLPRLGAEIGTGTEAQKHSFGRMLVGLINSRLTRGIGILYLLLEEWDGPYVVAGLMQETSQEWLGMPVKSLDEQVAFDDRMAERLGTGSPDPESSTASALTTFTTVDGLEGHRRLEAHRVDYWVTVDGGWGHLSCELEHERLTAALAELDALAAAIYLSDRVVGRRKKPPIAVGDVGGRRQNKKSRDTPNH